MSLSKRIIRLKKRRSKRLEEIDLDINRGNGIYSNYQVDCFGKRYDDKEGDLALSQISINSECRLNYSEMTNAREALVETVACRPVDSSCESLKESDIDDTECTSISSQNGIDVLRSWDYYQVMYSEEDGDSQIRDIDYIREWEADEDTDRGLIMPLASVDSLVEAGKKISIMTSGYETSPDTDPTTCVQTLLCILDFTTSHYMGLDHELSIITRLHGDLYESSCQSSVNILTQRLSVAQMHINLIQDILCKVDACFINDDSTLGDNLRLMEVQWTHLRDKCALAGLETIGHHMRVMDSCDNVEELRVLLTWMQNTATTLGEIERTINHIYNENNEVFVMLQTVKERFSRMRQTKEIELDIVFHSVKCLTESNRIQDIIGHDLRLDNDHEITPSNCSEVMENLRYCKMKLRTIDNSNLQSQLSSDIDKELLTWERIFDGFKSKMCLPRIIPPKTEQSAPHTEERSNHLSVYIAIVLVMVLVMWWSSVVPINTCRPSSSSGWIAILYKDINHLEPH